MSINYGVKKKVIIKEGERQTHYYAVPAALQKRGKPINERILAREMADRSSLTTGDAISVLEQLPHLIAKHLKNGRTIHITGLGTFLAAITSEGCESAEACTPDKVKVNRICFKADKSLTQDVRNTDFISFQLIAEDNNR